MTEQFSLRIVIEELITQNLLKSGDQAKIADSLNSSTDEPDTPWFVNVLIGLSAWIAIIPFIGFLAAMDLLESPLSAIVLGILLIIGTVVLHIFSKKSLFINQLTLALNLTGQILFIFGIGGKTKNVAIAALAAWFLEILLISFYRDGIIRFLGVIFATIAAIVLLYDFKLYQGIHALIVLLAAGAVWYWIAEANHLTNEIMASLYKPLGYGFVVALQTILLFSILEAKDIPIVTWWYSTIGLVVVLLLLEYHLLYVNNRPISSKESMAIIIGSLIVALLLYQSPGIIAAIIVLLLGFQRGNRVLMGLSLIFLTVFFVAFYYHLNITLLMKSMTLMSAGLVLLMLRFVFKYVFPLSKEGQL
jgi:hypothetical protein